MAKDKPNLIQQLTSFLSDGIWTLDLATKTKPQRALYETIRIFILAIKGVKDDKLMLRASALTYFSLLSIVPVLALVFGLAKGFGLDKVLEDFLLENFQGQEEIFTQSLAFAKNLLDSTKGGLVAGVGLIFLFYSVMKLLNNIEASFNDIWYVHKERNLTRKITDYFAMVLFGFILIVLANSITVYIATEVENLTNTVKVIGFFKAIILPMLSILQFSVLWLLFTLTYMIMPNTSVKFKSAFVGGIIAGTLFNVLQIFLFKLGVNTSKYNAIYGSFAALPLFLIWLQSSWIIVLFGSEISYAMQNVHNYVSNVNAEGFSLRFKKQIALATCIVIVKNFKEGKTALTLDEINQKVKVPSKLLQEVIENLIGCNILSETSRKDETSVYQPAIDTDLITVPFILNNFENFGKGDHNSTIKATEIATEILKEIDVIIETSSINKLVKEI